MSDETTNKFSLVDLPEVPDSVDNAVKNLTDKPTQNIGQTFADAWYLVFGGISQKAEKRRMQYAHDLECYQKELTESIDKIPNDKRIEPSIQVTAQALDNSKYCISSEKLRKMFVNLISGTMNKDTEPLIHPSFPEILKQMNEKDAKILKEIKTSRSLPIGKIGIRNEKGGFIPLLVDACILPSTHLSLQDIAVSLASLERAGLVRISYAEWLNDESCYSALRETSIYKQAEEISNKFHSNVYFAKGICSLTNLGLSFISVCVS